MTGPAQRGPDGAAAVHTAVVGDAGVPVVFLHGLMGQGKNFSTAAKALVPQARSLLVDLPNHGRSAWVDHVDYPEIADTVAAAVRAWSPDEPVRLVGHSMGGKVAMVLALRHPEVVERLVVVDIAPADRGERGSGEFEHLLGSLLALDLAAVRRRADADEALRAAVPQDTVRGFLLQNLRADGDGWRWQANLEVLLRDLPVIGGFPRIATAYDGPVLWVAGERSDYVTEVDAPEMRRLFPQTRQVTVKRAGHWVHSEQPEAFVSILRVFLGLDR